MTTKKEIKKGSIVAYNGGHYRVTRLNKNTANLGAIFGTHLYHKSIDLTEIVEAYEEWELYWTNSETYRCM
jgi:hypothetical protein